MESVGTKSKKISVNNLCRVVSLSPKIRAHSDTFSFPPLQPLQGSCYKKNLPGNSQEGVTRGIRGRRKKPKINGNKILKEKKNKKKGKMNLSLTVLLRSPIIEEQYAGEGGLKRIFFFWINYWSGVVGCIATVSLFFFLIAFKNNIIGNPKKKKG